MSPPTLEIQNRQVFGQLGPISLPFRSCAGEEHREGLGKSTRNAGDQASRWRGGVGSWDSAITATFLLWLWIVMPKSIALYPCVFGVTLDGSYSSCFSCQARARSFSSLVVGGALSPVLESTYFAGYHDANIHHLASSGTRCQCWSPDVKSGISTRQHPQP